MRNAVGVGTVRHFTLSLAADDSSRNAKDHAETCRALGGRKFQPPSIEGGSIAKAVDALADRLFDFIASVARASTIEELQRQYLDGVGEFVSTPAAGLYVLDPFTSGADSIAARGVSDFFLARYEQFGRRQDPVLQRALTDRRAVESRSLMTPQEWASLPVYAEVFRLHRMMNLMEAPIVFDGSVIGTLNFGRTEADGAFTAEELRIADVVTGLLGTALASLRMRNALTRERDQVVAALELCADAVVVTDLRTAGRRMNAAARRLLERLDDGEDTLEELMVHPVRHGEATRHEARVRLRDGTQALLASRSTAAAGDATVMISFLELASGGQPRTLMIGSLTPRELQVAELAAGGLRDAEIAGQLFLSPYTVKQYLKAVYSKLGVRSRVELARLVIHSSPPRRDELDPNPT